MIVQELVFYAFSLVLVFAAVAVITVRNPVYAVLFLVLAFFSASAIWMLLEAEFLAIILIVVYVGAVMVLFLFVVMMLDINLVPLKEGFSRYLPVAVMVAVAMAAEPLSPHTIRLGGPVFVDAKDPEQLARAHRKLGYAAAYLSFTNSALRQANEAVLPFYVLHQPVIVLAHSVGYPAGSSAEKEAVKQP